MHAQTHAHTLNWLLGNMFHRMLIIIYSLPLAMGCGMLDPECFIDREAVDRSKQSVPHAIINVLRRLMF